MVLDGDILTRQGKPSAAVPILEAAVKAAPDNPAAHYQLGIAMARMGYPERAVTALEAALALAPEMKRARRHLAQVRTRIKPSWTTSKIC